MRKILPIIVHSLEFIVHRGDTKNEKRKTKNVLREFQIKYFVLVVIGVIGILTWHQHVFAAAPTTDVWLPDSDVTFAGKSVVRARDFFDWTIRNYQWASANSTALSDIWERIRNIVFSMLILVVVGAATAILVTRGRNVGVFEFLKRFFLAIILIIFSFALIRFIYEIGDVLQGFFLRNPDGSVFNSNSLLNISFDYSSFTGFRKVGDSYTESAFIAILLVKLTAITYNSMAAILLVRKIILWFFLIVSPLFPLLLLYYPLKNTAKIWLAEFFRWVLYAPLFALLLSGLVALWKSGITLLPFNFSSDPANGYPQAINILLAGPGQSLSQASSLSTSGAYAQYVVALLMLWIVILLPFLLLRIFLDYLGSISLENAPSALQSLHLFRSDRLFPSLQSPRAIPSETVKTSERIVTNTGVVPSDRPLASYGIEGLRVPTLPDIAVFDRSKLSPSSQTQNTTATVTDTLRKIAIPERVTPASDREQFTAIRQDLLTNKSRGDSTATAILAAAQHTVASNSSQAPVPAVNTIRPVNVKDIDKVKSLWMRNFKNMQPPTDIPRTDWVRKEKDEAERAAKLLSSKDPKDVEIGKGMLSHVMAHILIGGFSLSEIVDYLKAKMQAADEVLKEIGQQESNVKEVRE